MVEKMTKFTYCIMGKQVENIIFYYFRPETKWLILLRKKTESIDVALSLKQIKLEVKFLRIWC